ncbi:hypothetical protein XENOCAPTIV_002346, partial [Xenoophorus captivus]
KLVDLLSDRLSHSHSRMVLLTACFLFFLHITRSSDQHLQALIPVLQSSGLTDSFSQSRPRVALVMSRRGWRWEDVQNVVCVLQHLALRDRYQVICSCLYDRRIPLSAVSDRSKAHLRKSCDAISFCILLTTSASRQLLKL